MFFSRPMLTVHKVQIRHQMEYCSHVGSSVLKFCLWTLDSFQWRLINNHVIKHSLERGRKIFLSEMPDRNCIVNNTRSRIKTQHQISSKFSPMNCESTVINNRTSKRETSFYRLCSLQELPSIPSPLSDSLLQVNFEQVVAILQSNVRNLSRKISVLIIDFWQPSKKPYPNIHFLLYSTMQHKCILSLRMKTEISGSYIFMSSGYTVSCISFFVAPTLCKIILIW